MRRNKLIPVTGCHRLACAGAPNWARMHQCCHSAILTLLTNSNNAMCPTSRDHALL